MKLAKDWFVVLPGKIYPEWLHAGDDCPADLAAEAAAAGVLAVKAPKPKRGK